MVVKIKLNETMLLAIWIAAVVLFSNYIMCSGIARAEDCVFPHPPEKKEFLRIGCTINELSNPKNPFTLPGWEVRVWVMFDDESRWTKSLKGYSKTEEDAYERCKLWRKHIRTVVHAKEVK